MCATMKINNYAYSGASSFFFFSFSGGGMSWELGQSFAGHESAKPKAKGRIGLAPRLLLFSEKKYNPTA